MSSYEHFKINPIQSASFGLKKDPDPQQNNNNSTIPSYEDFKTIFNRENINHAQEPTVETSSTQHENSINQDINIPALLSSIEQAHTFLKNKRKI